MTIQPVILWTDALIYLLLLLARRRPDVVPDPDRPGPHRGESDEGGAAAGSADKSLAVRPL